MKRLLTALSLLIMLIAPTLAPALAVADTPQQEVCRGIGLTTANGSCGDSGAQFAATVTTIINLLLIIIGVVAVVVIIVAGFNFITSGGDSNKVATARNSIVYALIGLVVVVLAEVIVHFVIGTVAG
jgi:hypothetical protein